jgi:purine-binding chemotaxis protein CheW
MSWKNGDGRATQTGKAASLFAIHGTLDGEKPDSFKEDRDQFIGCIVGAEEFLLPIAEVREIIMLPAITFVPYAPEMVDGVINLRGTILPAINLRKLLGVARGEVNGAARIILVRQEGVSFGLLVDGITYVIALAESEIERQSLPGKGPGDGLIGSIAKQGPKVRGILDPLRILRAVSPTLGAPAEEGEAAA